MTIESKINELAEQGISFEKENTTKVFYDCELIPYTEEMAILIFKRDDKIMEESQVFYATKEVVSSFINAFYQKVKYEL